MKSKEKTKNNPTNQWLKVDADLMYHEPVVDMRLEHGWAGYGLFLALLQRLRRSPSYEMSTDYKQIAKRFKVKEKMIKSIVEDFGLFVINHGRGIFYSEELSDSLQKMEEISKINSENGKKGAEVTNKKRKQLLVKSSGSEGITNKEFAATAAPIRQEENTKEKTKTEETIINQSSEETALADAVAVVTDDDCLGAFDADVSSSSLSFSEKDLVGFQIADRRNPANISNPQNPASDADFEAWFSSFPFDTSKIHNLTALVTSIKKEWNVLPAADKARCTEHTAQYVGELAVVQPLFYLRDRLFEKPPSAWAKHQPHDRPPFNNRSTDIARTAMDKAYTKNDLERPFVIKNKIIEC